MYRTRNDLVVQEKVSKKIIAGFIFTVVDKETGRAVRFYPNKKKAYEHKKPKERVILTKKLNYFTNGDLLWLRPKHKA